MIEKRNELNQLTYKIKNKTFRNFIRRVYYRRNQDRTFLLKKMPKNSICTEIGVRQGKFSLEIIKYVKPKKLFLIDSWGSDEAYYDPKNYDEVITKFGNNKSVEIIKSKSSKASKQFPDSFFDWIYIDADHTYNAVKTDLESFFNTVKNYGFITGDNYDTKNYPELVRAVDEFINKYPMKKISFKNFQYILQKEVR